MKGAVIQSSFFYFKPVELSLKNVLLSRTFHAPELQQSNFKN